MRDVKPWQMILLIAAALAMTASLFYSCSHSDDLGLAKMIPMVDVVTGDRFDVKLPKSGSIGIPCKHPDTGEETLVPYFEPQPGEWTVGDKYASPFVKKGLPKDAALDIKTRMVKFSDKPVRTIVGE
ncbi:MAG: hypothetical protein JSR77_16315 [Planctomycetes bacterium]|nr:hypothetical protein [Planctomycetota bacterium]